MSVEVLIKVIDQLGTAFVVTDLYPLTDDKESDYFIPRKHVGALLCYFHKRGIIRRVDKIGRMTKYSTLPGKTAAQSHQDWLTESGKLVKNPKRRSTKESKVALYPMPAFLLGQYWRA